MLTHNKLTTNQKQELLRIKKHNRSALIRDRAQAVLTRMEGFSISETAKALQRSEWFVKESVKNFNDGTLARTSLKSHNYKLSPENRQTVIDTIKTKTPKTLGFNTPFWTMKVIKIWIRKGYKIEYKDEKSYRQLFQAAGFTFHKPKPVDYRQDRGKTRAFKGALKKSSIGTKLRFSW